MFECEVCDSCFSSYSSRRHHVDRLDHHIECAVCDKTFVMQRFCNQHMKAVNHWPHEFDKCYNTYPTQEAVEEHMDAVGHWQHYCQGYKRSFPNENNLKMHLRSKAHCGYQVRCPFCLTGFVTASGLSHHLERGACPKAANLNRQTTYDTLRRRDPHGLITNKEIEWHEWAPNNAWNGSSYECYLCDESFSSTKALKKHLSSSAHHEALYHCLNRRCGKEFKTLAALLNHLESESCGYVKFSRVNAGVNQFFTGRNSITF